MKSYKKVTKTKLYRRFLIDPHNHIIKRFKMSKVLKLILKKMYIALKIRNQKINYRYRFKKKYRLKKKGFKKNRKIRRIRPSIWRNNFWNKLKKYKSKTNMYKLMLKRKIAYKLKKFSKNKYIAKTYARKFSKKKKVFKKKINRGRKLIINRPFIKKLNDSHTWLKAYYFGKKKRTWWLLRETKKRTCLYYGFLNMKKFRYINELSKKQMKLPMYFNHKLESMINIFLLRLNIVDTIFQSNNIIRTTDMICINGTVCRYPYKVTKTFDTVSINKKDIRRVFYMFVKRCKYNKSAILKYKLQGKGLRKKRFIRNVVNVPNWIEYNYKIMQFTLWRLPKLHEIKSNGYGFDKDFIFDWAIDTKTKYNNK